MINLITFKIFIKNKEINTINKINNKVHYTLIKTLSKIYINDISFYQKYCLQLLLNKIKKDINIFSVDNCLKESISYIKTIKLNTKTNEMKKI